MVTLRGRKQECARIDALLSGARGGRGGSIVIRGEPGIGKTALLEYAENAALGCKVLRVDGVESEMQLPYAALQLALSQFLDRLQRLPTPQAEALEVALGRRAATGTDRFLAGLGALGLLSDVAREQPVLCLVDDAQWIDAESLSVLSFAARRLEGEAIVMLFGTREVLLGLNGIAEFGIEGLADSAALELLASVVPGRLDPEVRDRIIAETRGNPLALLELPHGLGQRALAGGFGFPVPGNLSDRIEAGFLARVRSLPEPTQRLLLLASAEPIGDPALLLRASEAIGVGVDDAAPAEVNGLFLMGSRAVFRHPLVRSAIYRAATTDDRHRVHRALAGATDISTDQDRRAWHLAQATFGPDEDLALELEHSASRAEARGGPAAAAAFLQKAASLSSDPRNLTTRTLASAEFHYESGAADRAAELLDSIENDILEDVHRVRLERLRARVLLTKEHANEAPRLLLDAARRLESLDADAARATYFDAIAAAMIIGPGNLGLAWLELARAVATCPLLSAGERAGDELLTGIARQATDGFAAGVPLLRQALDRLVADEAGAVLEPAALWLACRVAMHLWDDLSWSRLVDRLLVSVRAGGMLLDLNAALSTSASLALLTGDLDAASKMVEEAEALSAMRGVVPSVHGTMALAAWQGVEEQTNESTIVAGGEQSTRAAVAYYTRALLFNGLGRYAEAVEAAKLAREQATDLGYAVWALPELVEAASRQSDLPLASSALEHLRDYTQSSGTDWALGMEARSAALVAKGEAAGQLYREAIILLERTHVRAHLARAHLLFGEWLRRENRRVEAREHLRAAQEIFETMGAGGFLQRTQRELAATGERVRKRYNESTSQLTPQESQIAKLAAEGYSNADIAKQLYISARTVEYHLHKIFVQLGISSRNQLNRALPDNPDSR